jgi:hypothetical protein
VWQLPISTLAKDIPPSPLDQRWRLECLPASPKYVPFPVAQYRTPQQHSSSYRCARLQRYAEVRGIVGGEIGVAEVEEGQTGVTVAGRMSERWLSLAQGKRSKFGFTYVLAGSSNNAGLRITLSYTTQHNSAQFPRLSTPNSRIARLATPTTPRLRGQALHSPRKSSTLATFSAYSAPTSTYHNRCPSS